MSIVVGEWYEMRRGKGEARAEWMGIVSGLQITYKSRPSPTAKWHKITKHFPDGNPERALIEEMRRQHADGFEFFGRRRMKFAKGAVEPEGSKPWPEGKAHAPTWLAKVSKTERERVRAILDEAKLGHRAVDILSLARPMIHFTLRTAKAPPRVSTRFGGEPDLPQDFAWPHDAATPLAFVAQFDLASLAALDLERRLPDVGLLSVFAHLDVNGDHYAERGRVLYFPDATALVRTKPAHTARQDGRPTKTALADATVRLTIPALHEKAFNTLRLTDDEEAAYDEQVLARVREARSTPSKPGAHQLLGWSDGERPSGRHELLAQVDSDGRFGFEIGDVETLRIWISSKKLDATEFSSSIFTLMQ